MGYTFLNSRQKEIAERFAEVAAYLSEGHFKRLVKQHSQMEQENQHVDHQKYMEIYYADELVQACEDIKNLRYEDAPVNGYGIQGMGGTCL